MTLEGLVVQLIMLYNDCFM